MEVGGWVQVSLGIFFLGKSSQNSSKPVQTFWSSIEGLPLCIMYVYTLLKVVSYYELSVLFMSLMCFQKKFGWVGGVTFFFNFLTLPLRNKLVNKFEIKY